MKCLIVDLLTSCHVKPQSAKVCRRRFTSNAADNSMVAYNHCCISGRVSHVSERLFFRLFLMLLNRGYMRKKIILKSFQCFISHVTTSETEIKLFHLAAAVVIYILSQLNSLGSTTSLSLDKYHLHLVLFLTFVWH